MMVVRSGEMALHIPFLCLPHVLEHQAKRIPDAPAILAPGRAPLSYGRLYRQVLAIGRTLRAMGIGRHDRVAIVLPNGPDMAVTIVAVAASATCAPLNQAYRFEELSRYFADLRIRALVTQADIDSPARRAALAHGIDVINLSVEREQVAGLFTLAGEKRSVTNDQAANADDVALLLLTSGTTSRPKIVPLTHAGICHSAYHSASALALCESDCGLNMLPLFHGHGLTNNVLASLAAGAGIVCAHSADVGSFFAWLAAFRPTWYSAVPTMHKAILAEARHNRDRARDCGLRFIRSASAPLAVQTLADLEEVFAAPVIETYGMTETTSSYIACNPLPPRQRKPGSVGLPLGLDVAIMGEDGTMLPRGQTGEVVVRGASVMTGYDGDEAATEAAFAGGWFKTGDLGFFDDDGYLFLTGRTREMINRGGEKISPQEVDEVLSDHPAVAEVVTFAVPHATLGEDVAAAIVLRSSDAATPTELRQFAAGRIAEFKVPRHVLIVAEIPKGPTGKKQRIGLAAKLGFATSTVRSGAFVAPRTPLEQLLAEHWAEVLGVPQVGVHDDFFALGGDSLLAAGVLCHIRESTKVELEISQFFEAPTIADVAHQVERLMRADQGLRRSSEIGSVPRATGIMPASSAQERLCRLQDVFDDLPFFNVLFPLRLTSPCDPAVLERSINEIVRRHEILRTTFAIEGARYIQVIAPQLNVPLPFDDLRASRSEEGTFGHHVVQEEMLHSFDLARGPLIRTRLVRLGEQEHLLLVSMHQSVCDGWSLGVFAQELVALYDAFSTEQESSLPPLPYQYADFADWQRRRKSSPEIVSQLAYWREQLKGPLPAMRLAKSDVRAAIDDFQTARRRFTLPAHLVDAARELSHRNRGTLFMVLVAALKTLLHRYLGEADLRVATNVANRTHPGTEALIGPLVNTVVLRTRLDGDPSTHEVLRRVRATTLAAFDRQDLPFEDVADTLERERAIEPASLARIMILLQNASLRPPAKFRGRLACEEANPNAILPMVTATTFDVILALVESTDGLAGTCIYKPHLFGVGEIDRLLRDFEGIVNQMVARPEDPISGIRISGM
jgi:acyl-CoA synthetase (AMP-forming)/AMP-acid ligase II